MQDNAHLTPERLAEARREWITDAYIRREFPTGDSWAAAKWKPFEAGRPKAASTAAPTQPKAAAVASSAPTATKATPPTAAALVAKLGRLPTQAELQAAEWAVTPALRREFSTADGFVWFRRAIESGVITPACDR